MFPQVERIAESETGGVRVEGSAESTLQRYSVCVCVCVCVTVLPWNSISEVFTCFCPDVIKEKGLEHVTVEDLVTEVTPKGRGTHVHMQTQQQGVSRGHK